VDKILIIEDDVEINTLLTDFLKENGYVVYSQYDGLHVLDFLHKEKIDLIILDIMLPYRSGDIILADIRRQFTIPVLIISAKETTQNKIDLLRLGADDYITKPFEIQEVLARIQVQLRHMQQEPEHKSVSYKNLELDRERFEVRIAGVLLPKITKQEFAILELLLEHPKQVFSKEEIFEYAWDEHYMGETKTLDVHISNIRKKIKAVTQEEYIDTVWGIGYRLHS